MIETLNVKPAEGIQVRKHTGEQIPVEGCTVPYTSYYRRRIKDGDLLLVPETKTTKSKAGAE